MIVVFLLFTFFSLNKGFDYILYDLAESQNISLFNFENSIFDGSIDQSFATILTFNNFYNEIPQVLISITGLDVKLDTPIVSFQNQVTSVTKGSFQLITTKQGQTILYEVCVCYLVITNKNVAIQNFNLTYSSIGTPVQFQLPASGNKQRQAQCFLTGFHITNGTNFIQTLGVYVSGYSQTSYTIEIIANKESLQYILLNCIEYYLENQGAYFMISDSQQLTLGSNAPLTDNNSPLSLNAVVNSNYDSGCTQLLPFIATTKFTPILSYSGLETVRFKMLTFSYFNKQQNFQVTTWYGGQFTELIFSFFQIQMYNCYANEPTNIYNLSDQNQCVASCPQSYFPLSFYSALICSPCSPTCATCINNASYCTSCPSGFYLDSSNICQQCDDSCSQCVTSSMNCLSCPPHNILKNNVCYLYLGCDSRLTCQYCFLGSCISCLAQNLSTCITPCPIGQYNLQAQCTASQPTNTYCSRYLVCTQCINSSCQVCQNDLQTCTSCMNNGFLFLKNCYQYQPYSTYCDSSKNCSECLNQSCLTCSNTLTNCLSCQSASILYNGSCYSLQSCNAQSFCQYCLLSNCISCQLNNPATCT